MCVLSSLLLLFLAFSHINGLSVLTRKLPTSMGILCLMCATTTNIMMNPAKSREPGESKSQKKSYNLLFIRTPKLSPQFIYLYMSGTMSIFFNEWNYFYQFQSVTRICNGKNQTHKSDSFLCFVSIPQNLCEVQ